VTGDAEADMNRKLPWLWMMLGALVSTGALAQAPVVGKPVLIIVPNAPGGGPDLIARLVAPRLGEALKQSVIVENRASANGIVATEAVARAASDGSVIAMGNAGTHAINATLYTKLPYDPVRDFAAVTEVASAPLVIVAHPAVPARSVKELIALARRQPGKLNIAVAGATGELAGNDMKMRGRVDMKNIPFKGGAPATISVISGETDFTMTNLVAVAKQIEAGKLKALGVTSAQRSALLPNVPTVAENGLEGYDHQLWYGMFVPAKTPAAVVQGLYREVSRIVALPDIRERLVATGHTVVNSTPEQFSDKVKREVEKFRKLIIDSGMPRE
jgi:tripartite-type tricarboxylate transporter receptor subunit TctC